MRASILCLCFTNFLSCGPELVEGGQDESQISTESGLKASLRLSPSSTRLVAGASAVVSIAINDSSSWAVTVSSLSNGVTGALSTSSLTKGAPVTMSLSADASALSGSQSFTVIAKSGSKTKTVKGSVSVTAGGSGGGAGGGTGGGGGGSTGGTKRVLFDAAHNQIAGNAYWVLDSHSPPQPAVPTSEKSWTGGISAWGYALVASGRYAVTQLSTGSALNWGAGGEGDLQKVEVFVSDEPEANFTNAEQAALMQFIHAGGGVFLASDHSGATRCSGCTEAWRVINAFLVTGAAADAFGAKCDGNNIGTVTGAATDARFTSGPFGSGAKLAYHSGSSVSATGSNAFVIAAAGAKGMMVGSQLGGGRLVLMGDSSPIEDGTCQCSANLHNGWGEVDDSTLILNATAWLAKE